MLTAIIFLAIVVALGVPVGRAFGFVFNPFWAFTNYKKIKENKNRASDFSNVKVNEFTPETSIIISQNDIPKPKIETFQNEQILKTKNQ